MDYAVITTSEADWHRGLNANRPLPCGSPVMVCEAFAAAPLQEASSCNDLVALGGFWESPPLIQPYGRVGAKLARPVPVPITTIEPVGGWLWMIVAHALGHLIIAVEMYD